MLTRRHARTTSLSVLVPVYNEQYLVAASLERLDVLETSAHLDRIEVIVIDDGSGDETPRVLERFRSQLGQTGKIEWIFLRHEKNCGKGKAMQTALARATCEISIIHDADLEYHPKDLLRIVRVFVEEQADAVFGSRFAGGEVRRVLLYWHQLGNRLLTFLCNLATNLNLTDVETCYKAVRTDLLKSIPIVSDDFRLEPELAIKLAKRRARIFEVPISYSGRTYAEGKKIGWRDGFAALWAIFRFALSDRIYKDDQYGSHILARLSRAPRFNRWMADVIRPYCGNQVLEIGSGVGNLTRNLIPRRTYVASDINPLYLQTLANLTAERPYLQASYCDVSDLETFPRDKGPFDTVICLNVIEHVPDDEGSLRNVGSVLAPGGKAIVLVPHGEWNYGTLDVVLGHKRRYDEKSLRMLAERSGFSVREIIRFNRVGTIAWFLNGKILRRRTFGLGQILMLNALTPLFRLVDRLLPMPPLSLIAVLERSGEAQERGITTLPAASFDRVPPEPSRRAPMPSGLLRGIALAVAAAVALVPPVAGLLGQKPEGPDEVSLFDRALRSLRPAIPPQARVGFLLASRDEKAAWYLAQYALAPSVVRPIVISDCVVRGAEACGAGQVEFLVVRAPDRPPDAIARLGARLGFTLSVASSGFTLLARKRP